MSLVYQITRLNRLVRSGEWKNNTDQLDLIWSVYSNLLEKHPNAVQIELGTPEFWLAIMEMQAKVRAMTINIESSVGSTPEETKESCSETTKAHVKRRNPLPVGKRYSRKVRCSLCRKEIETFSPGGTQNHARTHMTRYWNCPRCGSKYSRKNQVVHHLKVYHKDFKSQPIRSIHKEEYDNIVKEMTKICFPKIMQNQESSIFPRNGDT